MPVLVDYHFSDGGVQQVTYPAEVWRKNDDKFSKVFPTNKELVRVEVDPNEMTADINRENNSWPKNQTLSDFEKFKKSLEK